MYIVMYSTKEDPNIKKCSVVQTNKWDAESISYNLIKRANLWGIENVFGVYELSKSG